MGLWEARGALATPPYHLTLRVPTHMPLKLSGAYACAYISRYYNYENINKNIAKMVNPL